MSDVRRFWADLCVHHVEVVLYSDYAALEAELVMRTNERNGLRVSLDTTVLQVEALQAELAKLRAGQEPVAAQVRFRRPEKGLADWSVWQQTSIKPNMPAWSIDSAGYEVEYRLLYTAPQPSAVPEEKE